MRSLLRGEVDELTQLRKRLIHAKGAEQSLPRHVSTRQVKRQLWHLIERCAKYVHRVDGLFAQRVQSQTAGRAQQEPRVFITVAEPKLLSGRRHARQYCFQTNPPLAARVGDSTWT